MRPWQPSADLDLLQARACLNRQIRDFFSARNVLEVETPLLGSSIGTDPALDPVTANYQAYVGAAIDSRYLQTSPEFAMKRLLAAGSGAIYQLGKAFRNGESGKRHNPEFTMLEWYRPGFSLEALMDEVEALVCSVLGEQPCQRRSYQDIFLDTLEIDPLLVATGQLQAFTLKHIELAAAPDRDTCLELLYSHLIEPTLMQAVMITDYPASQAALAKIEHNAAGQAVARRFELVIGGMEIANGYDELADPVEQARRFSADLEKRRQLGLPNVAPDNQLVAALEQGMPACAGVALGVDRLLMLLTGKTDIAQVLAFAHDRI